MKEPLKKRLLIYIAVALAALVLLWVDERDADMILFVGIFMAVILVITTVWEVLAFRKRERDMYDDTIAERSEEQYAKFVEKKGFERVRRRTMKADLKDRYRSAFGYIMTLFGLLLILAGIFIMGSENFEERLTCIFIGLAFGIYGVYRCSIPQVRRFFADYAEYIPGIDSSYVNGKMLTFKRSRDPAEDSGINIGENFVVFYDKKQIYAVRRSEVLAVRAREELKEYYGGGLYTGSRKLYYLDMELDGDTQPFRSVELGQFQARLAAEEFTALGVRRF